MKAVFKRAANMKEHTFQLFSIVFEPADKVVLVAGSSMGLGKAVAIYLVKAGATVIINDPVRD